MEALFKFSGSETSFLSIRIEIPPHMLSTTASFSPVGDFAYRFEISSGGVWRLNPHPRGALGRCCGSPAGSRQGGPTPPHLRCAPGGDPRRPGIAAAGLRRFALLAALSGSRLESAGVGSTAAARGPECKALGCGFAARRRSQPRVQPASGEGVPAARLSKREPRGHFHSASWGTLQVKAPL